MAEPTLAQVFGDNASQTATDLIISKADLASVGLTASGTNNPEALIVAILLKAANYLNETTQGTNPDVQITISQNDFQTLVTRNINIAKANLISFCGLFSTSSSPESNWKPSFANKE